MSEVPSMFTREDVLSMVDAAFHAFASSYRTEAKELVTECLDNREKRAMNTEAKRGTADLPNLVGKHLLSGVDMDSERVKELYGDEYEDASLITFVLDGVAYTAIEDPSDGYRSRMRSLAVSDRVVKNSFAPVEVVGCMRRDDDYEKNEILDLIDTGNGKTVLSVGTAHADDYYPHFVAVFKPENMAANTHAERADLASSSPELG